jgi:hypothetical protein
MKASFAAYVTTEVLPVMLRVQTFIWQTRLASTVRLHESVRFHALRLAKKHFGRSRLRAA